MNKRFFLIEQDLVLLKKQNSQMFQYSFLTHTWYSVRKLKGIERHPELVTEVTEEEANDYIFAVEKMIENLKPNKTK